MIPFKHKKALDTLDHAQEAGVVREPPLQYAYKDNGDDFLGYEAFTISFEESLISVYPVSPFLI